MTESESEAVHEVPSVMLLTPYYGQVSCGLLNTINNAVRDSSLIRVVMNAQSSSSVLPHGFNQLLGVALTARDAGKITHIAMCHSDILAEPGWLDKLWVEMWTQGADLISAVVPIKGPTGRTSTAIGDPNDRWKIHRCINLMDQRQLPKTFGPSNVCKPGERLLVNTGLFLADLRKPWWDNFAFQFHTRIRKTEDGNRIGECRSEDWEMSHDLQDAGANIVATFAVRLRHEGGAMYPNYLDDDYSAAIYKAIGVSGLPEKTQVPPQDPSFGRITLTIPEGVAS